jgi:hypothetical protein
MKLHIPGTAKFFAGTRLRSGFTDWSWHWTKGSSLVLLFGDPRRFDKNHPMAELREILLFPPSA